MTCDLCQPTLHEILWQDDFCRVVLLNDADYPAYCRVELIAHIKEMTDLAATRSACTHDEGCVRSRNRYARSDCAR